MRMSGMFEVYEDKAGKFRAADGASVVEADN